MRWTPALLTGILLGTATDAQTPVGDAFPIAQFTENRQSEQVAAAQPDGAFVVVWSVLGADGDYGSIRGRRFSRDGEALTDEFGINQVTSGHQNRPRIAADSDGNFVVTWLPWQANVTTLFARLFAFDGSPTSSDLQVSQDETTVRRPSLSRHADGDFLVAWSDVDGDEDFAASFDAHGQVIEPPFVISDPDLPSEFGTTVALRPDRSFVVVWTSLIDHGDFEATEVFQQVFDTSGDPTADPFQLSVPGTDWGQDSAGGRIGVAENGEFFVAWGQQLFLEWGNVQGRKTDNAGIVGPVKVLEPVSNYSSFSMVPSGEFVVARTSYYSNPKRGGTTFDAEGDPITEFEVPSFQGYLLSAFANGDDPAEFVVFWEDYSGNLMGQRFINQVFADGFESGDTSNWPIAVP